MMLRLLWLFSFATGLALVMPALAADRPPPSNALPLSQIIAALESRDDVAYFEEVDWDDDGYWEIEYVTRGGRTIKLRIDPATGRPVSRN